MNEMGASFQQDSYRILDSRFTVYAQNEKTSNENLDRLSVRKA